ncbi:MAG TPA: hypothetical protein VIG32_01255 [Candidatus Baltobacteraceae bacterium]
MKREIQPNDPADADIPELDREAIERAQAVYGDTDLNPNQDDQRDAHEADPDEHV